MAQTYMESAQALCDRLGFKPTHVRRIAIVMDSRDKALVVEVTLAPDFDVAEWIRSEMPTDPMRIVVNGSESLKAKGEYGE